MTTIDFTLHDDHIALYHLLKLTGLCPSGGSAKQTVAEGRVRVDGQVELRKACKIRAGRAVEFNDTRIHVVAV